LSLRDVIPNLPELSRAPRRTFDCAELNAVESGAADLGGQFLGTMKVGRRQVSFLIRRMAVLISGSSVPLA